MGLLPLPFDLLSQISLNQFGEIVLVHKICLIGGLVYDLILHVYRILN